MVKIKLGIQDSFELGNLDAKRDWGYAKDYVEAMWLMLQQKTPQDFVISTGESHSVRDFVNATANALDMKITWHGKGLKEVAKDSLGKIILRINPKYYRPNEVNSVLGDSSCARKILKWEPKVTFDELVEIMTKADLESLGGVIGVHKDHA
jgi:GDPmannose 4,6-dehydratase